MSNNFHKASSSEKFGAVITSYNPPDDFYTNVAAICRQAGIVFVVDNASDSAHSEKFLKLTQDFSNLKIIYNESNLGVATALNQGVRKVLDYPIEWIATFDHDTLIPDNFFIDLVRAADAYADFEKVMLLAPRDHGARGEKGPAEEGLVAITSGTLHRKDVFSKVGFFLDELFIDCIDQEYCFRVKKSGYKLLVVNSVKTDHRLGAPVAVRLGPFVFWPMNYSPTRYFYIFRNSIWLTKSYFWMAPQWFLGHWWVLSKIFIKILIGESAKHTKLREIFRAFGKSLKIGY
nr:glycosyltransferase family 2 protein [Bdellovibrio sp. HAGR004]